MRPASQSTIAGVALYRVKAGRPCGMTTDLTYSTLLDFEIHCVITFGSRFLLTGLKICSVAEENTWNGERESNRRLEKIT